MSGAWKEYRVATIFDEGSSLTRKNVRTYLRDYNEGWPGCIVYKTTACSPRAAREQAIDQRLRHEGERPATERLFCPHCGAQRTDQPCVVCGRFSSPAYQVADPSIWVDGPDSEARLAARGECDTIASLRAEVERLHKRARWEEERTCEFAISDPCGECEACILVDAERDALAREDGEG